MYRVEPRPGGARPRPKTDAALRGFARLVLGALFREAVLIDAENMPATGPVLVIANHGNSIIDGAVLLAYLPRIPRFLAASTVWDYKPVAPFMNASGSVKVFRRQDGRAHEGSLEGSFAEAAQLLADGGVLAIFPEGRSHHDPALLPFKTGTARIARFTQEKHGPLDLAVVPLGVDYEAKNRFRTRVCFTFGAPVRLGPAPGGGLNGGGQAREPDAPRADTDRLHRALSAVAPDFADADEARALTVAGEIRALGPERSTGRAPPFGRVVAARQEVRTGLARAGAEERTRVRAALDAYARSLHEAGLADHELAGPPGSAALTRTALALVPGLPLALIALLFSYPQSLALRAVSRNKDRDKQLTWTTFGGLVIYVLSWSLWALALGLIVGAAVGAGWGWVAAAATLVAAPLSARLALPTIDRAKRLGRALKARRQLQREVGLGERLMRLRAAARAALDDLLAATPDTPG
jgi:glycerol-3-phosphate O-acyltransferase/dihydroxyacetone phosphate acyltransferase